VRPARSREENAVPSLDLLAVDGLAHVIAGSVEVLYLVLAGGESLVSYLI
jgi:hypothetical protein